MRDAHREFSNVPTWVDATGGWETLNRREEIFTSCLLVDRVVYKISGGAFRERPTEAEVLPTSSSRLFDGYSES